MDVKVTLMLISTMLAFHMVQGRPSRVEKRQNCRCETHPNGDYECTGCIQSGPPRVQQWGEDCFCIVDEQGYKVCVPEDCDAKVQQYPLSMQQEQLSIQRRPPYTQQIWEEQFMQQMPPHMQQFMQRRPPYMQQIQEELSMQQIQEQLSMQRRPPYMQQEPLSMQRSDGCKCETLPTGETLCDPLGCNRQHGKVQEQPPIIQGNERCKCVTLPAGNKICDPVGCENGKIESHPPRIQESVDCFCVRDGFGRTVCSPANCDE